MNINLNPLAKAYATKAEAASKAPKKGKGTKASSINKDTISISQKGATHAYSARLSKATANEIDSYSSVDRLANLKERISNGEYNVSANAVADAILGTDITG